MSEPRPDFSFVVPAYQEAANLPALLDSLKLLPAQRYEVLVADNGSTDGTQGIARKAGAKLLHRPDLNIGGLRNAAVRESRAPILVFLDADVRITPQWAEQADALASTLREEPMQLTGCRGQPSGGSWIERVWFKPLCDKPLKYLVSSHLITTRLVFDRIGGFDEALDTGEDVDFCERGRAAGARLQIRRELAAVDTGFPPTLRDFARRECWHGLGDMRDWQTLAGSKVALASLLWAGLQLAVLLSLAGGQFYLSAALVAMLAALCLALSLYKRDGAGLRERLQHAWLCYVYLGARFAALPRRLRAGTRGKRTRKASAAA